MRISGWFQARQAFLRLRTLSSRPYYGHARHARLGNARRSDSEHDWWQAWSSLSRAPPTRILQALAAWQWYNFAASNVPAGKQVLRMNLDETALCLHQGPAHGNVFAAHRTAQRTSKRRAYMTHVAVICDQREVQLTLPQVIIGNECVLPSRQMDALRASCPANVQLVRQKSAWNNAALCAQIVAAIGEAVRPHADKYQPVLLFDAAKIHCSKEVALACLKAGIWAIVVPARTTSVLQPLDTHCFQRYKAHLRAEYAHARGRTDNKDLDIGAFLACVYRTIKVVMQGQRWSKAFDRDGFGARQAETSSSVKAAALLEECVEVPETRPSLEQLAVCFPKRSCAPLRLFLRPFEAGGRTLKRSLQCHAVVLASVADREPRTRAEHRAAREAAATSAGSGPSTAESRSGTKRALGRTRLQTRLLEAALSATMDQ